MLQRLVSNWVYGGALAAIPLLLLAPLLSAHWPAWMTATFLHLPVYMVHQYEEHDNDRFRLFFNATMGKGHDVLSPLAVFITNVPGVWGVVVLSLYFASALDAGWALIAVYLVLVNALVHMVHAVVFRGYNPGLFTAIVLFLPLGGITLALLRHANAGTAGQHAVSLALAVAIHAAILIHVRRKLALQDTGSSRLAP